MRGGFGVLSGVGIACRVPVVAGFPLSHGAHSHRPAIWCAAVAPLVHDGVVAFWFCLSVYAPLFPVPPRASIFLIGFMGVGKSSVGPLLAQALRMDFRDSDQEIEQQLGTSISHIIASEGEQGFRVREQLVIKELVGKKNLVIATGGGVVLDISSRHLLSAQGIVIYLHASPETLLQRVGQGTERPLLCEFGKPSIALIRKLLSQREPLYQMLADHSVCTDNRSVASVVEELKSTLSGPAR